MNQRGTTSFLWMKHIYEPLSQNNLILYRLARISFELINTPFLLVIIQHYFQENDYFSFATQILQNLYVDSVLYIRNFSVGDNRI